MHVKEGKKTNDLDIRVYYSIPVEEGSESVPIRVEVDFGDGEKSDHLVNEIFNFRIEQAPVMSFEL